MPEAQDRQHGLKDLKLIIRLLLFVLLTAATVLICAGRIYWWRGWVYIGVYVVTAAVSTLILLAKSPELIHARNKWHKDTKPFDKVLFVFLVPAFFSVTIVAALDAGRFEWAPLATEWLFVGLALFLAGYALAVWAMLVNRHFEATVRIQHDRGHKVVTSGPYRYVRHPGYVGTILLMAGTPMILGSAWGFVAVAASMVLFLVRTAYEDRVLQKELPGYAEYARKVRYRLLPGIW